MERGQGVDLIPHRLGRYLQTESSHRPALALQGHVVQVLFDGQMHGELDRVATTGDQLWRGWRGHQTYAAAAVVLLPLQVLHDERALDDGHPLTVLGHSRDC